MKDLPLEKVEELMDINDDLFRRDELQEYICRSSVAQAFIISAYKDILQEKNQRKSYTADQIVLMIHSPKTTILDMMSRLKYLNVIEVTKPREKGIKFAIVDIEYNAFPRALKITHNCLIKRKRG